MPTYILALLASPILVALALLPLWLRARRRQKRLRRSLVEFDKAHDEIRADVRAALNTGDPATLEAALDAAEAKQRQAIARLTS